MTEVTGGLVRNCSVWYRFFIKFREQVSSLWRIHTAFRTELHTLFERGQMYHNGIEGCSPSSVDVTSYINQ